MNIHVYRARNQPATRYTVELDGTRHTFRCRRRTLVRCFKCGESRWAANMFVHVYYDGIYAFCRPGKGCSPT